MINIGIGMGWAKAIYSVANNVIANFKARVLSYPTSIFEAGPCLDATLEELNAIGLLDNASLVITPNAYNEGILYDVVPNTTLGDMNVVRATTATRVNSAGLIEVVPRNLYTYSEEFSNTNWTKLNATITANTTTAPNGTLTADTLVCVGTAAGTNYVRQSITINSNTHTLSFYAKPNASSIVRIAEAALTGQQLNYDLSNNTISGSGSQISGTITEDVNGWKKITFTYIYTSGQTSCIFNINSTSCFIWGAQLNGGTTATEYFPTTTRLNIPRIDYTNGSCPSLLVEPQRTNSLLNSQTLAASYSFNQCSITSSQISPDGTSNAKRITNAAVVTDPYFEQSISFSPNTYTWSIYVKQGTALTATIKPVHVGIGGDVSVMTFTFATETTTSSGAITTRGFTKLTNGWYRIYCSVNVTAAVSSLRGRFGNPSVANVYNNWAFPQLEVGAYPTSYIPTIASTVTRNADVISKTGISSLIGQTEGTLFIEASNKILGQTNRTLCFVNDTAGNNFILLNYSSAQANTIRFFIIANGINTALAFKVVTTQIAKLAVSYKAGVYKLFINGSLQHTQSGSVFTSNLLNVYLGNNSGVAETLGEGINSFQLYKTQLTDTECIALTTL